MSREPLKLKTKDEYFTPKLLVNPLLQYIKPNSTIWCPFDKQNSEYVIELSKHFNVIHSHIDDGQDFFHYEPEHYDCIISNPPFSKKLQVLTRLYELKKPFAILLGLPILNYQEIGHFFLDKKLQLLIFDKKVSFDGHTASFNSSYFCCDFLPNDLMFYSLPHNNSNKSYVASTMYNDPS